MGAVLVDTGKIQKLTYVKQSQSSQRFTLFTNNVAPDHTTTWASLTEASFPGYARQSTTWGAITVDGTYAATMTAATATFVAGSISSSVGVYGAALIDISGGSPTLISAQRFDTAPITLANPGDSIAYTLTLTDNQG
jgi:hypothetical protein